MHFFLMSNAWDFAFTVLFCLGYQIEKQKKKKIPAILLYKFKIGYKTMETAHKIDQASGQEVLMNKQLNIDSKNLYGNLEDVDVLLLYTHM